MIKTEVVELSPERKLKLKYNSIEDEDEIDITRLTKIDFNNIPAELVTIPVLLAEFSIWQSDLNHKMNLAKMRMDVCEGELDVQFREAHKEETGKDLSNEKTKAKVITNGKYKLLKQLYFKASHEYEMITAVFWALRSKDEKLTKLANSMQIGDAIENLINRKLGKFNYIDILISGKK
jgi:hypothetical protein